MRSNAVDGVAIFKGAGKFAAAVVLPVQPQFLTKPNRLQISVFFLKVARQPSALISGEFYADFVDFCGTFKRTERKCRTEKIEALSRCLAYRCC